MGSEAYGPQETERTTDAVLENPRTHMASKAVTYESFNELIASLRSDGLSEAADRLHVLLHEVAWTTGSELIGELGLELKRIESEGSLKKSPKSLETIEKCFRMVFREWPDFPR